MKTGQAVWEEEGFSGILGYSQRGENTDGTWRESERMVGFCISGTQEQERAQHGAWQVQEVHWMSVLFSVPEIWSSGGREALGWRCLLHSIQVLWLSRRLEE